MPNPQSRVTLGIFSHGGTKNLGDEALFAAVLQNVRARFPQGEIKGFTINPDESRKRHGIACYPIRRTPAASNSTASSAAAVSPIPAQKLTIEKVKSQIKRLPGVWPLLTGLKKLITRTASILAEPKFLWASYRHLRGVDLLLVAGSQQLSDHYGGAWGFPYTLYKWALLSRLTGTKVAVLSVGAGPVDSPLSRFFVRRFLNMVAYRSYRDAISSRFVESIGVPGSHPVYPDLVYSLQLPAARPVASETSCHVVGINPVPFWDDRYWPTSDPGRYNEYLQKLVKFAEWLSGSGHAGLFFPTQIRADALTIADIRHAMQTSGTSANILAGNTVENLEDLVTEISRADFVVANRYHGILISLAMNKPVIGIIYQEKCRALLEQVGQPYYTLNAIDFKVEDLVERFQKLEANALKIRKEIAESIAPCREALQEQYDTVFRLIGHSPSRSLAAAVSCPG